MPKVLNRRQSKDGTNSNMHASRHKVSFEESECGLNASSSTSESSLPKVALIEALCSSAKELREGEHQATPEGDRKLTSKRRTKSLLRRPTPSVCLSAMATAPPTMSLHSRTTSRRTKPSRRIIQKTNDDERNNTCDPEEPHDLLLSALSTMSDDTIDSSASTTSSSSFSWWGHFVDIIPPTPNCVAEELPSRDHHDDDTTSIGAGDAYVTPTTPSSGRYHNQASPGYQPYTIRRPEDKNFHRSPQQQYQDRVNERKKSTHESSSNDEMINEDGFFLSVPPSRVSESDMLNDDNDNIIDDDNNKNNSSIRLKMKKHTISYFGDESSSRNDELLMDSLKRLRF